jgi:cytochrome c oxidase subunit IV
MCDATSFRGDTTVNGTTSFPPQEFDRPLAHIVEARVLFAVFAALVVLTAITVAVSCFDFGAMNLVVALAVAAIKAALVALWFMHLRYESPLHAFIFLVGIAFLGLFLVIAMLDAVTYRPNVETWRQNTQPLSSLAP